MTVCEEQSPFTSSESDTTPSGQQITSLGELDATSPGERTPNFFDHQSVKGVFGGSAAPQGFVGYDEDHPRAADR